MKRKAKEKIRKTKKRKVQKPEKLSLKIVEKQHPSPTKLPEKSTLSQLETNAANAEDVGLRHCLRQVRLSETKPDTILHTGVSASAFAHNYIMTTQKKYKKELSV